MSMIALSLLAASLAPVPAGPTTLIEHPFTMTDDAIIVEATVNGRSCHFLFDTGYAGVIIVNPSTNVGKPTGTITLRDFVGQMQADTVALKSLALGKLQVDTKGMDATYYDQGDMSSSYGTRCDGIMGLETVMKYVTEINFQNKKFIFHPSSEDISKRVPDNKNSFLLKMLPTGHNSIELRAEAPGGNKFTLALDTGNAFYATTHKDKLVEAGLWKQGDSPKFVKQSFVASGAVDSFYLYLKDMKIFGVPVAESVWDIIDLPSSSAESSGTVGFQFLKNFNVTFDMERRYVWLQKYTDRVSEAPVADIGVYCGLDPESDRVRAFRVLEGGPGERAGLKRGDSILSVNGDDPAGLPARKLFTLFNGKKGEPVKITASRNGQVMHFEIKREYMINNMPKTD